jgi:hypothetical protein
LKKYNQFMETDDMYGRSYFESILVAFGGASLVVKLCPSSNESRDAITRDF